MAVVGAVREDAAALGASSAYSTVVQGYRVTAVGEVPPDTVRAIAQAIRNRGPAPATTASCERRCHRQRGRDCTRTRVAGVPAGHARCAGRAGAAACGHDAAAVAHAP